MCSTMIGEEAVLDRVAAIDQAGQSSSSVEIVRTLIVAVATGVHKLPAKYQKRTKRLRTATTTRMGEAYQVC